MGEQQTGNLTQGLFQAWWQVHTVTSGVGCYCYSKTWQRSKTEALYKVAETSLKKESPKQSSEYEGLNAQWDTKLIAWKERYNCRECLKRKHRDWAVNLHLRDTNPTAQVVGWNKETSGQQVRVWEKKPNQNTKPKPHSTWLNISPLAQSWGEGVIFFFPSFSFPHMLSN